VARRESRPKEGAGLPRLPPGRHGLPRELVVENQKQRIAAGMIAVVVSEGYADTTVTRVVAAAGISRRTFYNYYRDKEEAFVDVYGEVTGFLLGAMREGAGGARGWPARVRGSLAALLDCYAANPDLARFTLEAPHAAGGEVAGLQREFLERILTVLSEGQPKRTRRPSPAAEYGLIGGLAALVSDAIERGSGLGRLLPELVELVLTPYIGREAAAKAAR
jgi:AcrR family transcriptional regulator